MQKKKLYIKLYLSNLQYVFFPTAKCICPNCKINLSTPWNLRKKLYIRLYLPKLQYVFVPTANMYFSQLQNQFVHCERVAVHCTGWNLPKPVSEPTTLQRPSVDARWTTRESFLNRSCQTLSKF